MAEIHQTTQSAPGKGKLSRNLHWWLAGIVAIAVGVGLAIMGGGKTTKTPTEQVQPQVAILESELARQKEKGQELADRQQQLEEELRRKEMPALVIETPLELESKFDPKILEAAAASDIVALRSEDKQIARSLSGYDLGVANPDQGRPEQPLVTRGYADTGVAEIAEAVARSQPKPRLVPVERNRAFLGSTQDRGGTTLIMPPNRAVVIHEGTIIPAVLQTAVNSDLPGQITARVRRDVYDTVRGNRLVIPKGAMLVGRYSSDVANQQTRVLVAFHRLIFPDGQTARLENMQGMDAIGQSGLHDKVDTHFWEMLGSGLVIALLAKAVSDERTGNITVIGGSTSGTIDAAGQVLVETSRVALKRRLGRKPTLTLPLGYRFNIFVNRDIAIL